MEDHKYRLLASDDNQSIEVLEMVDLKMEDDENSDTDELLVNQLPSVKRFNTSIMAYGFAFSSCIFFATGSMFTKLCSGSLNALQIVLIRSFVQLCLCVPYIVYKRLSVWQKFSNSTRFFLIVRGLFGGVGLALYFYAFQNMPLGDASAIIFSSPVYVVVLARVFLKEKFGCAETVILILNLTGVLLVAQPSFLFHPANSLESGLNVSSSNATNLTNSHAESNYAISNVTLGTISAIAGSLSSSFAFISIRKLPNLHFTIVILYLSIAGIIVTSTLLVITKTFMIPSKGYYWGFAFIVGLFGILGQVCLTKAFQMENAGPISIIRQLDIVLGYIFQITVFHEPLQALTVVGAGFVISGSVSLAAKKWMKSK